MCPLCSVALSVNMTPAVAFADPAPCLPDGCGAALPVLVILRAHERETKMKTDGHNSDNLSEQA